MITRIEISGFKSFWDFSLDFAPFTVVAGANASGKSNLFDAMRLLSNLATTDLRTAFTQKMGLILLRSTAELHAKLSNR